MTTMLPAFRIGELRRRSRRPALAPASEDDLRIGLARIVRHLGDARP
ncbi:hypothetical protein HNP84_002031 [Thermocatellispora tengchongensis]|uniref:Uncharacterized protein n=1 Tax=Thermocatellispora tengchongensis TaxID=1073253 RepID=A0A840P8I7_9ACTN|nr:hypothetical protein [Thermocatellispora tengchongensis]MBB5132315.1 hypothetical protein [Thermocatellispora tengchongensis]